MSHNLNLPEDITGNILQDNYCTTCKIGPGRLAHMIKHHGEDVTVKNCFEFLGKAMQFGKIRQDIGDLFLIPGRGAPVHYAGTTNID